MGAPHQLITHSIGKITHSMAHLITHSMGQFAHSMAPFRPLMFKLNQRANLKLVAYLVVALRLAAGDSDSETEF